MWPTLFLLATVCSLEGVFALSLDLTHDIEEGGTTWVGTQPFHFTSKKAEEIPGVGWVALNEFCASEHGGTHLDAPYHFSRDGWFVGNIPLDHLIVPGVVIDVSAAAQHNPDFKAERGHIEAFEQAHGPLGDHGPKIVVLFKFGWSQFFTNKTAYFGTASNDTSRLHFPGISEEAARKLVDSGNVVGVGLDTPSVDPGQNDGKFMTHRILSEANIYNLENVAMDIDLPAKSKTRKKNLMKHRLYREVTPEHKANVRLQYNIEEQNMYYLRNPYLTVEQSKGHAQALGKSKQWCEKWRERNQLQFKESIRLEDRLGHLRVKEGWD